VPALDRAVTHPPRSSDRAGNPVAALAVPDAARALPSAALSPAGAQGSGGAAPRVRGRPFPPGVSGNPGGSRRTLTALVRERTDDGAELVGLMVEIMRGAALPVAGRRTKQRPTLRDRMAAVEWLADRAFGKVPLPMEHGGPEGGPLALVLRVEVVDDRGAS
jgi:hypothetical protein